MSSPGAGMAGDRNGDVIAGGMDYKKSYLLMWILYLIGFVLIGVSYLLKLGKGLAAIGVCLIATGFFQTLIFFHCPRCGMNWVQNRVYIPGIPHYCPYCGEFIW